MIAADCAELIRRFGLTLDDGKHRGLIMGGDGCPDIRDATSFKPQHAWADGPYREVYTSNTELAVFTYCEGDLTLEICSTRELYDALILSCKRFYL